ncbi:MAG TPA: DUF2284 domain-containing protein [Prolixibacteraceae bacterium]|nr:DUF2284 domain-containing protein [Prolixibacteraceae bacterium]
MKYKTEIENIIRSKGLHNFQWIDPKEIVVSQWVRVKCLFGCNDYGLGACPPNTPSVAECIQFFQEYSHALIFRFEVDADKNKYPSEWSKKTTQTLLEIEKELFKCDYPRVFLLNQTCCCSCKECPGNRFECKDKKNSRPSPEGFAVDVYETVKKVGWTLHVVIDNPALITRIALIMID